MAQSHQSFNGTTCWLCGILNIHSSDFITNIEVLEMVKDYHHWGHASEVSAMLGRTPHKMGIITCSQSFWVASSPLPIMLGVSKKWFKDYLKKSFGACHINYHQWSTLTDNYDTLHLTTMLFPPLKTPAGPLSWTNSTGGRTLTLSHQSLSRPSAAVTATPHACPASALSVMNAPTVGIDWPLLDFYLTKPSHKYII